jgi:hypothetical protein
MGPFIKRLSAWLMSELSSIIASRPSTQAVHVGYEKAGRILFDAAVPWNADAVLVETTLRLPERPHTKSDFGVLLPGMGLFAAEALREEDQGTRHRLFFRLPTPRQSLTGQLIGFRHILGSFDIRILGEEEFLGGLSLEMPSVFVTMGSKQVSCQTFVSTQGQGITAVALLRSRTSHLAPLATLNFEVVFQRERDQTVRWIAPVCLTGAQLQAKQAMVAVKSPKSLRRLGHWELIWRVGSRELNRSRIHIISQKSFRQSLRVSDTRFVVLDQQGQWNLHRQLPPFSTIQRLGPCFLLSSQEAGAVGSCTLSVHAVGAGAFHSPLLFSQEMLLQDGLTLFVPGTIAASDLMGVVGFELRLKDDRLGYLPLSTVPRATFNSEGGFQPAPDFIWTPSAEEELTERLNRLYQIGYN